MSYTICDMDDPHPPHSTFGPAGINSCSGVSFEGVKRDKVESELDERKRRALAAELEAWWERVARDEILRTVPKAVEYSSSDLIDIGRGILGGDYSNAEYTEAGIAFYALGKVSRIIGAIREGRFPSDDSWFDLGVYARMAQRTRESGGWPTS